MKAKQSADWRNLSAKLFCAGFFACLFYLILKYAVSALLPFLIAYTVSLIINPLSSATAKATGIPRKLYAAIYVTLFLAALVAGAAFCVTRLFREAEDFISGGGLSRAFSALSDMLLALGEKINLAGIRAVALEPYGERLFGFAAELEKSIVGYLGAALPRFASGVFSRAPSIFIGALVTVMSCYYFCIDASALTDTIKKAIPEGYREKIQGVISLVGSALKRYVRAYLILMVITFCEVYAGLLILRVEYAFLIAAAVAIVDLLPILGAGTVLVPWAAVCFFGGEVRLGVGLIILYGIVTIVRQIAEPHVVGASVGIHPALSLVGVYAGFRLFGIFGMILGPLSVFVASEMLKEGREKN